MQEELIILGKIVSVHGLKGDLKVYSFTDPLDNILDYNEWILCKEQEQRIAKLVSGRLQGKVLVAKLVGVTDRDQARAYVGYDICIPKSQLPLLAENEYYWHQLQGLKVINQQNQLLGRVDHLLETGANDVLVVKPCEGSLDDKERLVPYVDQFVLTIGLDTGEIKVDWDAEF